MLSNVESLDCFSIDAPLLDKDILTKLKKLNLLFCFKPVRYYYIGTNGPDNSYQTLYFDLLWEQLRPFNSLESLNIALASNDIFSLDSLVKMLQNFSSLRSFSLVVMAKHFNLQEAFDFYFPFEKCPHLISFKVFFSRLLTNESSSHMLKGIRSLKGLKEVSVEGHGLTGLNIELIDQIAKEIFNKKELFEGCISARKRVYVKKEDKIFIKNL